jgi:hypothetical protein
VPAAAASAVNVRPNRARAFPLVTILCMCVDLSPFLSERTWDGERMLFVKLFERARVLITPGKDLHFAHPGWFRICFAM